MDAGQLEVVGNLGNAWTIAWRFEQRRMLDLTAYLYTIMIGLHLMPCSASLKMMSNTSANCLHSRCLQRIADSAQL